MLTPQNYQKGYLVDGECLGGVTLEQESNRFLAYVLKPLNGEFIFYRDFSDLEDALDALNSLDRPWSFEAFGCGDGPCAKGESCSKNEAGACPGASRCESAVF